MSAPCQRRLTRSSCSHSSSRRPSWSAVATFGRGAHGSVEADLYALAEAMVGSLFLLAVAWWLRGRDIVGWAETHELSEHRDAAYMLGLALLLIPHPLGLVAGWVVSGLFSLLERWRLRATRNRRPTGSSTSLLERD